MAKELTLYHSKNSGESKTLMDWSKSSGISASTLFCRLKRGMDIDQAIEATTKPVETTYESVTDPVSGETHTLREWARIRNIPYFTLYSRIAKYKWPVEKVLYGEKFKTVSKNRRSKDSYTHIDLTGRTFGHLKVLRRADTDYVCNCNGGKKYEWKWLCECDCTEHNRVEVIQHNLLNGHCTSCGCANTNNLIDLTGQTFGHLKVLKRAPDKIISGEKVVHWYCQCDCEDHNIAIVSGHNLRTGHTISCGCRIGGVTHGKSDTRLYNIYSNMMHRCYSENTVAYKDYGGRGIFICDEWYGYGDGFLNFYNWALENGYSDSLTIDRADNNGPYAPWNCRWVTMETQGNNKRNNVYITYNGETYTASQWGRILNVGPSTLIARRNFGWTDDEIIGIPINYATMVVSNSSGVAYTIDYWSKISGIDSKVLYNRIFREYWPVDTALTYGAMNQNIYNYMGPNAYYMTMRDAIFYIDILGNRYTQKEWEAHQAVYFD